MSSESKCQTEVPQTPPQMPKNAAKFLGCLLIDTWAALFFFLVGTLFGAIQILRSGLAESDQPDGLNEQESPRPFHSSSPSFTRKLAFHSNSPSFTRKWGGWGSCYGAKDRSLPLSNPDTGCGDKPTSIEGTTEMLPCPEASDYSVVQWHRLFFFFFVVAAPLNRVFPKKGSLVFPG